MVLYKENGNDAFYYRHRLILSFASKDILDFCKKSKNIYYYINDITLENLFGLSNQLKMIACNRTDEKAQKVLQRYLNNQKEYTGYFLNDKS